MLTQRAGRETIGDESLENWRSLGSGGFGEVLRVKHKDWHFEVAIKLLHVGSDASCPALWREADYMDSASIQYFPRVYGMYRGCPPDTWGGTERQGIVMELMERGSLQSLQQALSHPPPWALAVRLADQVALAMNFLHSKELVHMDLKPANVLLDANLNAKITDFGLCSVSTSVLKTSDKGDDGCTPAYTPPEAFDLSYEHVRSYDIYSYGILLWTILTGKEPYPAHCDYSLLAFRIKMGDRPDLEQIDQKEAIDGLEELVGLMERCWDAESTKRPSFRECIEVTSDVFSRHAKGINKATYEVLTELDQRNTQDCVLPNSYSLLPILPVSPALSAAVSRDAEVVRDGGFGTSEGPPMQDADESLTSEKTDEEKALFVLQHRARLTQSVSTVMAILDSLGPRMVHPELYAKIRAEKTSMEQMRTLYMTRLQFEGAVKIRAAFYDALKQHEPHLLD